jgi:hyperosmotically inducible protein
MATAERDLEEESVMKKLLGLSCVLALVCAAACGRTDAGITSNVKSKLAADETVKAYQVNVDTQDHVVTLSGTVDTLAAKSRAVDLARQADGVRDVIDNIRVNETVATSGRDVDDRAADRVKEGADATAAGTRRAGDATANGIRRGADAVANSTEKAGHAVQREAHDTNVPDKAKEGGDAVNDGAKKVGNAAKKGAEAVADGAKKVGSEIKDAVTDKNKDSDHDGK